MLICRFRLQSYLLATHIMWRKLSTSRFMWNTIAQTDWIISNGRNNLVRREAWYQWQCSESAAVRLLFTTRGWCGFTAGRDEPLHTKPKIHHFITLPSLSILPPLLLTPPSLQPPVSLSHSHPVVSQCRSCSWNAYFHFQIHANVTPPEWLILSHQMFKKPPCLSVSSFRSL